MCFMTFLQIDRQKQQAHVSHVQDPSNARQDLHPMLNENSNIRRSSMKSTPATAFVLVLTMCLLSTLALGQTVAAWQNNTAYKVGDLVTFNSQEYRCQIAHTSQADWTPDVAHSLWLLIQAGTPDFTVSATPTQQFVTAGSAASYTVSMAAQNGFTGTITLSVAGLPTGATARFSPSAISTSGSSTL